VIAEFGLQIVDSKTHKGTRFYTVLNSAFRNPKLLELSLTVGLLPRSAATTPEPMRGSKLAPPQPQRITNYGY
jgi:hypothetical protein